MQGLQQYGKYGLCALLLSAGLLGSSLAESGEESGLALSPGPGKFTAVTLRCENLVNPLGIGETAPRLSWQLAAPERGQRQAAYHILVASSARLLDAGTGDLWDSGKVTSDETIGIVYGGKKLASHQRCFWKVRVWDKNDQPSDWTERAMWSMGLLDRSDWHAEWIGYDKLRQVELPDAPFGNAMWIWHAADPNRKAPKGHRLFLSQLELPQDFKIEKAELLVTADDAFKFVINTQLVAVNGAGGFKQPQMVDVTQHLRPGANSLRVEVENGAEGPAGLLARLVISAADGRTALHLSDRSWKSTDRPGANWHNREIDSSDWPAAVELGEHGAEPWGRLKYAPLSLPPPAYLRTSFRVDKHVQRATLYATALGVFDVHVNGHRAVA